MVTVDFVVGQAAAADAGVALGLEDDPPLPQATRAKVRIPNKKNLMRCIFKPEDII
jgi:hypothetical protein